MDPQLNFEQASQAQSQRRPRGVSPVMGSNPLSQILSAYSSVKDNLKSPNFYLLITLESRVC
jgi:hypothetical protein